MTNFYSIKEDKSWQTCEKEEAEDNNEGVSKVKESRGWPLHLQLGEVEVDAVDEEVDSSKATSQERSPPPMVVLQEIHQTMVKNTSQWKS